MGSRLAPVVYYAIVILPNEDEAAWQFLLKYLSICMERGKNWKINMTFWYLIV